MMYTCIYLEHKTTHIHIVTLGLNLFHVGFSIFGSVWLQYSRRLRLEPFLILPCKAFKDALLHQGRQICKNHPSLELTLHLFHCERRKMSNRHQFADLPSDYADECWYIVTFSITSEETETAGVSAHWQGFRPRKVWKMMFRFTWVMCRFHNHLEFGVLIELTFKTN